MRQAARLGMALFFVSESVFFFMLLLAFIIFRGVSVKMAAETLNLPLTSAYTICLVASGLTVWRAARPDWGGSRLWLAGTILLGSVFLLGQGSECLRVLRHGVTVSQSLFGTTFFTLAAIHGTHVLVGILLLVGMLRIADAEVVRTVASFWLFVAGVWIVIFSVVYLWTFL
jgi:cytochrome c oxidase subunit 3